MAKEFRGWIYIIKNSINGKMYVGRTNDFHRRYIEHFGDHDSCTILAKAFKKYGKENFTMYPIVTFTTGDKQSLDTILNFLEVCYIKKYNTYKNGYNATFGGEGNSGWKPSKETLRKRSVSLTGRKVSEKERQRLLSYVVNRVWTDEQKEHHRQMMIERHKDPEYRKRVLEWSASRKGVPRNKEVIMRGAQKRRRPILQYSLDGEFLKEYPGTHFTEFNGASIAACCSGKLNSAYGFIWKYKTSDIYPLKIKAASNWHKANRPIIQYNKEGVLLKKFKSATEASKITGIGRKTITNCLGGRSKSAGGYIWKYEEERRLAV